MIILEISAQENGAHRNNIFKGLNSAVDVPDGWIEVPESLESDVLSSLPFLDLQIENGKLVGITPTERPEPEPEPYTPTQEDRLSALEGAMLAMMGVQSNV